MIARLRREDFCDDPIAQFARWLEDAARGAVTQPLAGSLATVGADGRPRSRTVLLKFFNAEGFVFFTHLGSRKVRQMAANPNVSLLFPWLALNRQVNITGRAEKLGAFEAVKCFLLGENNGVTAHAAVEMQLAELVKRLGAEADLLATGASWGGYRIAPETLEFFQGHGPRQHDRFLYTRAADGSWSMEPLD
ncbi:MAG: pyridoxal 5'-phosphate synthase [Verrucomicrobia bacterium]|nr:pyridoxal 5'-phosphate synthase [Verrucomicrobiota bacterium]